MNRIKSVVNKLFEINSIGIIIVYILVFGFLSIACPNFYKISNIMVSIRQAVYTVIVGMGMCFVISMGGIDLSVGSIVGISGMLSAMFILDGMNIYLAILLVVLIGAAIGLVNGFITTKMKIPYFIGTLATMQILRGLIYVKTKGVPLYGVGYKEFTIFGQGYAGIVPIPIIISIVIVAICYYLFNKTKFGRYTVSIGSNEDAAKLVGIGINKIKILVFVLSGILCALAGIILCARSEAAVPDAGSGYEMDAIAACVIGGTSMSGGKGSIIGTVFGAILMATIKNGLSILNVNTFWHQVVIGLFIIAAVSFDGLTSARRRNK